MAWLDCLAVPEGRESRKIFTAELGCCEESHWKPAATKEGLVSKQHQTLFWEFAGMVMVKLALTEVLFGTRIDGQWPISLNFQKQGLLLGCKAELMTLSPG